MFSPELRYQTPHDWAPYALQDFGAFLTDHASCERKASAVGLSFVVRYPDRTEILDPLIRFAREELEHFHQVYRLMQARGLQLGPDEQDAYVNQLMKAVRTGRDERFLDRLLVSSLIEARGTERLKLVASATADPELQKFYTRLAGAEAHHHLLFIELASTYFSPQTIEARLDELLDCESLAIQSVPYRHALH